MQSGIIEKIEVRDLFGQFSYIIPNEGTLVNPAILYGDNGVGKSTLLNLIFHLLSSSNDRGHRGALWRAKYSFLSVSLHTGYKLSAERPDGFDSENVVFTIHDGDELKAEWTYGGPETHRSPSTLSPNISDLVLEQLLNAKSITPTIAAALKSNKTGKAPDGVKRGEKQYIEILEQCAPKIFIVSAERRLVSDTIADSNSEFELDEIRINRYQMRNRDVIKDSRQVALKQALANASIWVQDRVQKSAAQGSMNVHNVYEQILKQLSVDYSPVSEQQSEASEFSQTLKDLESIEERSEHYSKYDLTSAVNMSEFRESIGEDRVEGREISAKLIDPYVRSVLGRLDALQEIYVILDRFIVTINRFLTRKHLEFSMRHGFRVVNDQSVALEENQLSSGEQQLLLMFCYALTAQDKASVFIIDEPEISLNVKWQRQLLRALIDISDTSKTQFVFASHSMELIAQHRNSVVELGR